MSTIKTIWNALVYPWEVTIIALIYIYKVCISPCLPKACRFYPTCSSYMILAIKEWGIIKGIMLGINRICRCTPRGQHGCDYVPLNVKGDLKWIY